MTLITSILLPFTAPVLHWMCSRRLFFQNALDGFIFISVIGLVLVGILPEVLDKGGAWTLLLLIAGLALPTLTERFVRKAQSVHNLALFLALLALFFHAITDGAALVEHADEHSSTLLSVGVLLHRIPVGLTIWWFAKPQLGVKGALAILVFISAGTSLGFIQSTELISSLNGSGFAAFQAFVAGSLLHVAFHRPHTHGGGHQKGWKWAEGFGNLLGIAMVAGLLYSHLPETQRTVEQLAGMGHRFLDLAMESAPALLLAYLLSAIAGAFIQQSFMRWMDAPKRWQQAVKGVGVGLPLPVCSCGVVPLYHTLVKKGAPPAAALAFLLATPEIGVDAVLISLPLLGEEMTLVRVAFAAVIALVVAITVSLLISEPPAVSQGEDQSSQAPWQHKLKHGLTHGLNELIDHTGPWILIGLLVAAAMQPLMDSYLWQSLPDYWEVPLFALLGMPLYVCALGATPMVAILLVSGVSPGAALAFLITGPATNMTTYGVLSQLHGKKIAFTFGCMTFAGSVLLGTLVNLLMGDFMPKAITELHNHDNLIQQWSLGALAALFGASILRRGARGFLSELLAQGGHLSCDHEHHHGHSHGGCGHSHGSCGDSHGSCGDSLASYEHNPSYEHNHSPHGHNCGHDHHSSSHQSEHIQDNPTEETQGKDGEQSTCCGH